MQWTGAAQKVRIYVNTARKSMSQIRAETGCDIIINGGLYNMNTFKPVCHLKVDGTVLATDQYTYYGYGWNDDGKLKLVTDYSSYKNYICCVCLVSDGKRNTMYYGSDVGGGRARTAIGTMANGDLWLYIGSNPQTPESLQDSAMFAGVQDAIMLDGGGSTQGILPNGTVTSARNVHNYICIWTEKATKVLTKQNVIDTARGEIGYLEKASNKDLDSKTANAGNKNFNKYARDLDKIAGWYNTKKQGYDWCAVFFEDCFVMTYGVELTKKLLPHTTTSAGCTQAKNNYVRAGRFYKAPAVGDQIFFRGSSSDVMVHTGLVVAVDATTVTTIEGNTSSAAGVIANGGCVRQKTYSRSYSRIGGYGRPNWGALPPAPVQPAPQPTKPKEETLSVNDLPTLKRGNTGATVRALQIQLKGNGYNPNGIDGSFGPGCESAVRKYQSDHKLTVDGVVNTAMWKSLLGLN